MKKKSKEKNFAVIEEQNNQYSDQDLSRDFKK
jgi:hypothetical protein